MESAVRAEFCDAILWDVQEEHLSEAEYLLGQWTLAHESPTCSLPELAGGVERRLFAHFDGLAVGGPRVAERLLEPLLASPDESSLERLACACLALLMLGRSEAVTRTLWQPPGAPQRAAETAFGLFDSPSLDHWIVASLQTPLRSEHRCVLLRLAARRGLAVDNLLLPLQSDWCEEVSAAAEAARFADPGRHLAVVESLLSHPEPQVRDAALMAALTYGSVYAREACFALAAEASRPEPLAMLLSALFGGPAQHQMLLVHVGRESHREAALFALGYSGQVQLVPALLEAMRIGDERCRKLAGEAFSTLTGLDLDHPELSKEPVETEVPALEDDDLEADLVPDAVDKLALPDPDAVAAWWRAHHDRVDSRLRLLGGKRFQLDEVCAYLESAPLRRRHAPSMWLSVVSSGRGYVNTRAFSGVQRAQIAASRRLDRHQLRWATG